MPPLKNSRHEKFALALYRGATKQDAAIKAGYSEASAHTQASRMLHNAEVLARIKELQEKTAKSTIMSKQELAEMYSRMLGTLHSDFLTMSADGVWMHDIGEETLHQEALKKVKTRIVTDKGKGETILEKQFDEIELESKSSVGQALAKLMGYDAPTKHEIGGNIEITENIVDAEKDSS